MVCGNGNRSRYRRSTGLEARDRAGQQRSHSGADGKDCPCLDRRCGIAGLVAAISLKKKGIPGHDRRGGDGILPCKPSQNVLPSLPLHPMMPVIRSTRYLIRAANRPEQASASPNASRVICRLGLQEAMEQYSWPGLERSRWRLQRVEQRHADQC